jgi:signal transduction histidine kinase
MSSNVELLKQKAILLLRREQELYALGVLRERTSAWLRVFEGLPIELDSSTPALPQRWVRLLIDELRFQAAVVMKRVPASGQFVLVAGRSRAAIPQQLAVTAETLALLAKDETGMRNAPGVPALDELATQVGLSRFMWALDAEYLIIAGFVPDTAAYIATFTDEELRCFGMLGRHLFALLRNCKLVVELHESLATVRLTQAELAAKVSELVVTREQLVQNEKLAMAGELAGSVAHEVNNPLSVVIGSLDLMLEYKGIGAVTYLRNQSDPEAHVHANRLCAGENSQQELAGTIGNVVGTIDSMLVGARRLADLVDGFWRFAERRSSAPVVVDLGRAARELAEEYGVIPTLGPPLVAMVAGDDLRVAVRGLMAFLSEPERRQSRAVAATKIHTDVRAGRPCVVVSDPDVIVSAVDCRGIFDPRVRVDTRGGRTLRLDLDLALAYQNLLVGGAEISFDVGDHGLAVRFSLPAASAVPPAVIEVVDYDPA